MNPRILLILKLLTSCQCPLMVQSRRTCSGSTSGSPAFKKRHCCLKDGSSIHGSAILKIAARLLTLSVLMACCLIALQISSCQSSACSLSLPVSLSVLLSLLLLAELCSSSPGTLFPPSRNFVPPFPELCSSSGFGVELCSACLSRSSIPRTWASSHFSVVRTSWSWSGCRSRRPLSIILVLSFRIPRSVIPIWSP